MDHRSQNVDGILSVASDRDICRLHTTGKRAIVPSQLAGTHDCQRCVVTGFECFNHAQCFQFLVVTRFLGSRRTEYFLGRITFSICGICSESVFIRRRIQSRKQPWVIRCVATINILVETKDYAIRCRPPRSSGGEE